MKDASATRSGSLPPRPGSLAPVRGGSLPPRPGGGPESPERYVVRGEIASGGMGSVYHVFDRVAGEERALKRVKTSVSERPFFLEAFEREYQVLAGLDHPRIIRVFDYGVDERGPYYTMELLAGEDLGAAGALTYREACSYLRDIATSLALLHARRLVHRDLSAGNVRRTPDGHCKLLDFGALTAFGHTREIVGTPPAIPPEALANAPLDHRSDLYQLGALAYFLLTRQHAYPAERIDDLTEVWQTLPPAPSELVPDVPPELDTLVLSLLSHDPLARPANAAEVISRLEVIGELAPEDESDAQLFAQSFLLNPRFVGRSEQLTELAARATEARNGAGCAVLVQAAPGIGRTRLLEEVGVRAQLAGVHVVRVDASVVRHAGGTLRALAVRLLDTLPSIAREEAQRHRASLLALGREVEARLGAGGSSPPSGTPRESQPESNQPLESWFAQISRRKALLIEVDNVEYADDTSMGVLVSLASAAREHPLMLLVSERIGVARREKVGLAALRHQCLARRLPGLSEGETLELARSLFGEVPNVERFAEWLYDRTGGRPLHCVEITRQLVARSVIRYAGGMWQLPTERSDAELPAALEDALSSRLDLLSESARVLAECLSLQRERPTLALCRLLLQGSKEEAAQDDRALHGLLDELARNDVMHGGEDGYRFSSTALREAVLASMDDARRKRSHARLGEAFAALASESDSALRLEAGFHLIRGGDELRGAEMITRVSCDSVAVRTLIANLHHAGRPLEAALKVYKRERRSVYLRAPLLAALAHAAYYEDRAWSELYADEALDTLEQITGLRLARFLARFVGRHLGLFIGLSVACIRFYLEPRAARPYSFYSLLVQLFGAVTTLSGAASLALDVDRAGRVAATLAPFSVLPERATPVGIYQFCRSIEQIGRDNQAEAYAVFDKLLGRFEDPNYYVGLPEDARLLYVTGCHFARGAFATMRADGPKALESAELLDGSGLKLYAMIASALRFLYFTNRGEIAKAAVHREQVELHAAKVGSAWQVELWEPPALIPIYTQLSDLTALTRLHDRLQVSSRQLPTMALYARLARAAQSLVRREPVDVSLALLVPAVAGYAPRSFIGWAAVQGFMARGYNGFGRHAEAREICLKTLEHLTPADQAYVSMFLEVELQLALAEAGLGETEQALRRIEGLLERYRDSDHPLLHGSLHEARAQIAWSAGLTEIYEHSLAKTEQWFRPTGTPALVAKCERLAELAASAKVRDGKGSGEIATGHGAKRRTGAAFSSGRLRAEAPHPADLPTASAPHRRKRQP